MLDLARILLPFVLILGVMALLLRSNQRSYARRAEDANAVQRDIARQLERIADSLEQRRS